MAFHQVNPPEAFLRFHTFSACDSSPTCPQFPASTAHDPGDLAFCNLTIPQGHVSMLPTSQVPSHSTAFKKSGSKSAVRDNWRFCCTDF